MSEPRLSSQYTPRPSRVSTTSCSRTTSIHSRGFSPGIHDIGIHGISLVGTVNENLMVRVAINEFYTSGYSYFLWLRKHRHDLIVARARDCVPPSKCERTHRALCPFEKTMPIVELVTGIRLLTVSRFPSCCGSHTKKLRSASQGFPPSRLRVVLMETVMNPETRIMA